LIVASAVVYYQIKHFETFDKILLREITKVL